MSFWNTDKCVYEAQQLQPQPFDGIGGPGVITVVVGTAWIAIGATILHYLVASTSPENGPSSPADAAVAQLAAPTWLLRWLKSRPRTQESLAKSVLFLSDIQTFIGLVLLGCGFLGLSKDISAYHFMLVVQISWFAHLTQLAGLSILRGDQSGLIRWMRIIRAFVLGGALIAAIIPTLFFNWAYFNIHYREPGSRIPPSGSASLPGSRAACFYFLSRNVQWHYASDPLAWKFVDTPAFGSGVAAIVMIGLNVITRTVRLQQWLDKPLRAVRKGISNWWVSRLEGVAGGNGGSVGRVVYYTGLATLVTVRLLTDLAVSSLSGIYWLLAPALAGTIALSRTLFTTAADDDKWTFTQALPVIILAALLFASLTAYLSREREGQPTVVHIPNPHAAATSSSPLLAPSNPTSPVSPSSENALDSSGGIGRDIYNHPSTSSLLLLPLFLLSIFSALLLTDLATYHSNAASAFGRNAFPFLFGVPATTYLFVLVSLIYEGISSGRGRATTKRGYTLLMLFGVLATGGVYTGLYFFDGYAGIMVMGYVFVAMGCVVATCVSLSLVGLVAMGRGGIRLA